MLKYLPSHIVYTMHMLAVMNIAGGFFALGLLLGELFLLSVFPAIAVFCWTTNELARREQGL